jgi:hypothetical protein
MMNTTRWLVAIAVLLTRVTKRAATAPAGGAGARRDHAFWCRTFAPPARLDSHMLVAIQKSSLYQSRRIAGSTCTSTLALLCAFSPLG